MSLITLIVVLILVGVALWLLNTYVPMAQPIKTLINVLIVVLVFVWVLQALGFLTGFGNMRVGR